MSNKCNLRSSNTRLRIHTYHIIKFSKRAFKYIYPNIWNCISYNLRYRVSQNLFKYFLSLSL